MSEEKIAVIVESVAVSEEAGAAVHFTNLQDATGRLMRIYIGKTEALALSQGLQVYPPDRPHTYDALLACLAATESAVEEVAISDLQAGLYHASVSLRAGGNLQKVRMRPSDALNLAVRVNCPLFVSESVFLASQPAEDEAGDTEILIAARPPQEIAALSATEVSEELAWLYSEDQADRLAETIDWETVVWRDAARLGRVKQLYQGQKLMTGLDYYHAAMVLQHSSVAEDHLLAHEFCVVAISRGVEQAKWLAAASEDRFLMNIGRPQRFGTQYRSEGPSGAMTLYSVDAEVEDSLRSAMNVPPLLQAQE